MDEYNLRILKLVGVLVGTIVIFLVLLWIHIPFGIALLAAMAAMAAGIKYVRKDDTKEEDEDAERSAGDQENDG